MDFLKMIFVERHDILANIMMIAMGVMVVVLVRWLKKAYAVLESGSLANGDPETFKKFSKDIDAMFAESKNIGATLNRKVEDLYARLNKWDAQISTFQKGLDDMRKQMESAQKSGPAVKADDILAKLQDGNKELMSNLNKRIEDLYEKTHRFNDQLVSNQRQVEEIGKNVSKVQGSLTDLAKMPKEGKSPDVEKFTKNVEETGRHLQKVNTDLEHMHNKMIEHEDQINDLKRIFEDMDATFAEMNKRFQKIETYEQGN